MNKLLVLFFTLFSLSATKPPKLPSAAKKATIDDIISKISVVSLRKKKSEKNTSTYQLKRCQNNTAPRSLHLKNKNNNV